jgi:RNA polymerase sigma-70 factor (ECF subfamily)
MEQRSGIRPDTSAEPSTARRLTELFARSQAELLGTLYHLLGNTEDARDALQEAFVKCWRHQAESAGVANLRAWVFRVVLNTGRDLRDSAWRRRRRPLDADRASLPAGEAGPEAEAQRQDEVQRARRAIGQLRAEEQDVFLLRQNGELTYEQIGEMLKIPVGTVKTRMRLALEKLRRALNDDGD